MSARQNVSPAQMSRRLVRIKPMIVGQDKEWVTFSPIRDSKTDKSLVTVAAAANQTNAPSRAAAAAADGSIIIFMPRLFVPFLFRELNVNPSFEKIYSFHIVAAKPE